MPQFHGHLGGGRLPGKLAGALSKIRQLDYLSGLNREFPGRKLVRKEPNTCAVDRAPGNQSPG